ncbi:MAG: lipid-A-disaccharide synthase [Pseudomonadota bacterium]
MRASESRLRIAITAGEPSGDALAAPFVQALRRLRPDAHFYGIAGPRMMEAGVEALFPMEKLSVMGYAEVLRHYFEIVGIRRKLQDRLLADLPDLFVGVDAPDFNLDLEIALRARGIRTVQYVGPTVWAWRAKRIHKVARAADRVLALFPFEEPLYRDHGIPVTYVGHPLADAIPETPDRAAARLRLGLPQDRLVVALLPGSRVSELHYMADLFVGAAVWLRRARPGVQFVVPLVNRLTAERFERAAERAGGVNALGMRLLSGQAHIAMAAADGAIVASGTATLETALHKRPMVITYKISPLTWRLVRNRGYLPYVGLPNILAGKFVVPEFLQDAATPQALGEALLAQLDDPARLERIRQEFTALHRVLKRDNANAAARAVLDLLEKP